MFCGSAAGVLSFPYVVYKGPYVYPLWTVNGPPGAMFSATPSGWFDIFTYCDWLRQGLIHNQKRIIFSFFYTILVDLTRHRYGTGTGNNNSKIMLKFF